MFNNAATHHVKLIPLSVERITSVPVLSTPHSCRHGDTVASGALGSPELRHLVRALHRFLRARAGPPAAASFPWPTSAPPQSPSEPRPQPLPVAEAPGDGLKTVSKRPQAEAGACRQHPPPGHSAPAAAAPPRRPVFTTLATFLLLHQPVLSPVHNGRAKSPRPLLLMLTYCVTTYSKITAKEQRCHPLPLKPAPDPAPAPADRAANRDTSRRGDRDLTSEGARKAHARAALCRKRQPLHRCAGVSVISPPEPPRGVSGRRRRRRRAGRRTRGRIRVCRVTSAGAWLVARAGSNSPAGAPQEELGRRGRPAPTGGRGRRSGRQEVKVGDWFM